MRKPKGKGSDIPPDLRVTHGKNGIPELPAVPCLVIVVGPPIMVEPGEQPRVNGPCDCPICRYRMKHTGHA